MTVLGNRWSLIRNFHSISKYDAMLALDWDAQSLGCCRNLLFETIDNPRGAASPANGFSIDIPPVVFSLQCPIRKPIKIIPKKYS